MMLNELKFMAKDFLLRKLHSNIIVITELTVRDADGKIVRRYKKHGRSLTGNFLQHLYAHYANEDNTDFAQSSFNGATDNKFVKGDDGAQLQVMGITYFRNVARVGVGSVMAGTLFGTGTTAPTALDYKIETLIPHGTGAGQFSYQQQGASQAPKAAGNTTTFILQRIAVNNSGGSITVSEIALYTNNGAGTQRSVCAYRDLVSPAQEVLATQTLTAQITFQVIT